MNLAAALLGAGATGSDRPALVGDHGPVTHRELGRRAARAADLIGTRVAPGERVAIVAGNEPEFVTAYLGVLAAGAVAVPVNPAAPAEEIARELTVARPALVMASEEHADRGRRATSRSAAGTPVLVIDAEAAEAAGTRDPIERSDDDLAVLLFTAGTAGPPKAAMLTHGALRANLDQLQRHDGLRLVPEDVALGVLPFFHVFGLNVVLDLALIAGAALVLVEHFHPAETLAQVARHGVTVVAGVPAIYAAWCGLADAHAPADALRTTRLCVSGAAALEPATAACVRARFGVAVHEGYGLTEAAPVVATSAIEREPRPGSIGPPLPGVEVRLVDGDGAPVLEGDAGAVEVRGANVFAGYFEDPDASAQVFTADGWLRTGDIAVADADGWLTLVDRAKDVIIVSGFNVYPGEVEDAIASHPAVADVAVIGEPHPRTGEAVVAFVAPRAGERPDPVELLRHAGRQVSRYKLPTRVELVDEVPRSFTGKVLRRVLSAEDAAAHGRGPAAETPATPA